MITRHHRKARELSADVLIIGGGTGACAAALAAARNGCKVIMTEETDWIGGQWTQQAVPPDEHPWIEQFGATRAYREFRCRVRDFYRRNYPLTGEAQRAWNLNPGNGTVSRLCHEPRAALAVLQEMLQPHLSSGRLTLLLHHKAQAAETKGDVVRAVLVRCLLTGDETVLRAPFVLDGTELGDLLPLTGAEFVTGAEGQEETGEPHAPAEAQPENHQAFTCCFAMSYHDGEDYTIDRPEEYDFWRSYVPQMTPAWTGPLLSLTGCHPITLERRDYVFDPAREPTWEVTGLWLYRRLLDKGQFAPGAFSADICLVNWPQNDYWLGNLVGVSEEEAAGHIARAKQLSLSLLYWLQTEAPRPDGGTGWKGLRLRPDVVGTADGLAKYPYIRESRRIRAEFTVLEQHVGTEARRQATGLPYAEVQAERFADSVGVGSYRIDLHPSTGGDNYIDVSSLPFQIPLGALIPVRMENLLPACKNLGVTHITNGCYRLHPVEWNIGEAAGMLAAFCLTQKLSPRAVRSDAARLSEFQKFLTAQGIEIEWPRLSPR
ncbi:MAG TPA: FAD-dependent oxidoreductase [Chthonomonadaceae bacterium]|nr:FAD-dependent oxidoreductase [Chthonomonadaceae bacterium]